MKTIKHITEEIATKCRLLDEMIEQFLAAKNALDVACAQYEANIEALNLFNLTIRNVEGVITLARDDLVLLPPARLAARAALESSVRAAWLVDPMDPFERELRWIAHFEGEEDYLRRQIKDLAALGSPELAPQSRLQNFIGFRTKVSALLAQRGYSKEVKFPNFRECLRSLGEERIYLIYSLLSQTAHATHASTWLYRDEGIGSRKKPGTSK